MIKLLNDYKFKYYKINNIMWKYCEERNAKKLFLFYCSQYPLNKER